MDENSIYDSEVSPKEIIKRMKLNIFQNTATNNNSLINIDYLLYRPSIFSLIKKISNKIGFKSQTYFLSIYYLDILHIKHQKIDLDLKVLSLACLLLAAKYAENDQNVPNLPYFVVIFNSLVEYRDIISIQDLIYAEVLTCKLLEYKLNYYTVYDFDSFFFGHGIIKIEQLKELNKGLVNNNSNNDFNDINFEINENSFYIRKILEKIYRKSRYYLDQVIYNGNICLKYNSLITSVVIMKKSVEDILIKEQKITETDIKEFKTKSGKYFKEIMNEIYQIDYETMEEYQNLIADNDLINIFQDKNKKISNYIHDTNIKLVKTKRYKENLSNNRYQNVLNQTVDGNVFVKKLNFSQKINRFNFRKQNVSGIETENDNFLYLSRYKKERISVPKRHLLSKKYTDINRFNSTFSNNFSVSKKININNPKEQSERNQLRNTSQNNRRSELNGLINYIHTYTNDFYRKKRKESNSIKKTNIKNINIDDSFDDTKDLMDTMKNNMTLQNGNALSKNIENNGRSYEKYKKLVLRKRFFNRINMHNRLNEYSISHLDNSNTLQSMNTFDEKNPKQNFNRPYSKKVIKNITNYTIKQNSKVTSFYSTMNNNMYNPGRRKQNKKIILNPFPYNNILNNEIVIENNNNNLINKIANDNKQNATLEVNKNNDKRKIFEKNIFAKKNYLFEQRKKIYSNNILLNSMSIENNNSDKNKEISNILLTSNNNFITKKNERQKLLFNRMKNINNKINFKNSLNNTEIKNEIDNQISKRKFLITNNKIKKELMNLSKKELLENNNINNNKDKIYENQIMNKNGTNKRNMNKINTNIIKEFKPKGLRFKFINKKTFDENISDSNKICNSDKNEFPNTSIFKLLNKTKTLNENKLNIPKEELNSDLVNNINKNINNQNKKNKIIKNINNNIDFNKSNNMIDTKSIPNIMFNTIDNVTNNNKKENNIENITLPNKNVVHSYHYRNYMKNKIKKNKEKELDKDKNKNENSKTIVINNNININFNNKIENSNIYPKSKNEFMKKQVTSKMNESKEFYNKLINNNKNISGYHTKGTIECNNINKDNTCNNISSLLHRIPFYKKTLENNKKKYSRDISKDIKFDN